MTTKFIYTRSYTFTPEKGRNMFFELIERGDNKIVFRLRDKGNVDIIDADLQVDEDIECCSFICKGREVDLWADQYIPKGFTAPRHPDGSLLTEEELQEWKKTCEDVIKDAHLYSSHHREEIDASADCGCYDCQHIFPTTEIEAWTDEDTTAICPFCGTDAVIPNIKGIVKVSPELLKALNEKYF